MYIYNIYTCVYMYTCDIYVHMMDIHAHTRIYTHTYMYARQCIFHCCNYVFFCFKISVLAREAASCSLNLQKWKVILVQIFFVLLWVICLTLSVMQIWGKKKLIVVGLGCNKIFFPMWFSKIHLYAELWVRELTYLHDGSGYILAKVPRMKQWMSDTKFLLMRRRN